MLNHLFTTPLWHRRLQPPQTQVEALRDYLLEQRATHAGVERSNRGGWHSQGNLFDPAQHRQFPFLQELVTNEALAYFHQGMGFSGDISFALTGWAVINRAGDSNHPHNHAHNLISGAFYLQVPGGMEGGQIVFMDPRLNVNAYGSENMEKTGLAPQWNVTRVAHRPQPGEMLLFPSWLMHYVEDFRAPDPEALRIVISFNIAP